jgi:geranylgeranyl diphosphate synthase type 3
MPSTSHPFASPNAIPPRTSSTGILDGTSLRTHRSSVLRPLAEVDWMSQSKKSKTSHSEEPLDAHLRQSSENTAPRPYAMASQAQNAPSILSLEASTNYPTPISPPSDPTKDVGEDLIYGNGAAWTEEKERILLGPYDYLYGHPGKDIRSQCIAAFNLWLKVPPARLEVITRVVGMLHTASLLYVVSTSSYTTMFILIYTVLTT